jgi:Tfp pilus assembly protein PilO
MKPEQRMFILKLATAAVVGLFLLDHVVISPLIARWRAQGERLDALNARVQRGRQLLDREDSIRTQWGNMMRANLPGEVAAAENLVYRAIGRWARTSQITFTSLTPQWQTHEEGYNTLECRIAANGDQATIGRFIYELEIDPLPVSLEECEITTRDAHGSELMLTARFSFLRLAETGGKGR